MLLGDLVEESLTKVGITKKRVKRWFKGCCCDDRKQKLNELDQWARKSLKLSLQESRTYINRILGND